MRGLLFLIFCITFFGKAYATTYYVNDGSLTGDVYTTAIGNNANPGTVVAPFATLDYVVNTIGLAPGDIVFVDAGTYFQTDANLALNVNDVSIIGAGSDLTIFDNNQGSVDSNRWANVTGDNIIIEGIKLTGYNYGLGGASALNINGVTGVQINDVLTDENKPGGGSSSIVVSGGSIVDFTDGGANCNTASSVAGGGVNVEGNGNTVTFDNYSFSNNSKDWQGGSGLYISGDNTTNVTVVNSIFADNTNGSSSGGGAIFIAGANLTVDSTCFTNNTYSYSGGPAYGGAICVGRGATVDITSCTFSGNSTSTSGKGGAIAINTSFAGSGSAAVVNVDTCSFVGNSADSEGNDLYARVGSGNAATFNVNECTFSGTGLDIREDNTATINIQNSGSPSATGAGINMINTTAASALPITNCPVLVGSCYTVPCTNPTPTGDASQSFCVTDNPTIADLVVIGGTIVWYDASSGGSVYIATDPLVNGTSYYASDETVGCDPSDPRLEVVVSINDTAPPTGSATQSFCIDDNSAPTVADLAGTGNNVQWYSDAGTTTLLAAGDALTDGSTYYGTQTGVLTSCESSTTLDVTVAINDTAAPTGSATQSFCIDDNPIPTIANLVATGNNVQWYSDAGATILLALGDALTDGSTYYGTQTSVLTSCESSTTLDVTVAINDTVAPTGSNNQSFCIDDNPTPTVADLVATGNNVQWYSDAGATMLLGAGDALSDGSTYYGTQTSVLTSCESSTTLDVIVAINDTAAPIGSNNQSFCIDDNPTPTVADLVATGNNVQWYSDAGATMLLGAGDALSDGSTYYGTQTSVLTSCESSTTLNVTVAINDTTAPTGSVNQSFCLDATPTVADLSATGNNIQWYSDATTTLMLNSTDVLSDGLTYYSTQTSVLTGCESSGTFDVLVTLFDPLLDTTGHVMSESTCGNSDGSITGVTLSGGQPTYNWSWSDGVNEVATTQDLTNQPAGTYTVTVTDNLGCVDSIQAIIISDAGAAVIDVSGMSLTDETCEDDNGSITNIVVTGGNGNLAFEWNDGVSVVSTEIEPDSITAGSYSLTITDDNGCIALAGPFTINDLTGPSLNVTGETIQNAFCNEPNGSISGITASGGNGVLTVDWNDGTTSVGSTLDINNLLPGSYTLSVTDTNGCSQNYGTTIISDPVPSVDAEDDATSTEHATPVTLDIGANDVGDVSTITVTEDPVNGAVTLDNIGNMTYTPEFGFSGTDTFTYSICDEFCTQICTTALVTITVGKPDSIHIPNGFSPNLDGFNDMFVIEGLEHYPDNEIIIFNRWGDEVFQAEPYLNDWDGTTTNNKLKLMGDQVTEGTYYYILDLHVEGVDPYNGFIELRRN